MEQQSLPCGTNTNDNNYHNDASTSYLSASCSLVTAHNTGTSNSIHEQDSFHYNVNEIRSHMQRWNPFICNWEWCMFVARWCQIVVDEKCCYDPNYSCPCNWFMVFKQWDRKLLWMYFQFYWQRQNKLG